MQKALDKVKEKYNSLGENPEKYLLGLAHAKPLTYWDYIQVDTLLSLQKTRTGLADEKIFVIYHQITELIQELVLHELQQITGDIDVSEKLLIEKLKRINRYILMLINSFDVMRYGMNYDDYNAFRNTLTPASGFQSANFRYIELRCTSLLNLINQAGRKHLSATPSLDDCFENLYWKDAGTNHNTGELTLTLRLFCEKYEKNLKNLALQLQGNTLEDKINDKIVSFSSNTLKLLKEFDHLYNVVWPLVHMRTAAYYLDNNSENKEATGGSEWKKYLHPQYQQRKFFPKLWSKTEIENWGENVKI